MAFKPLPRTCLYRYFKYVYLYFPHQWSHPRASVSATLNLHLTEQDNDDTHTLMSSNTTNGIPETKKGRCIVVLGAGVIGLSIAHVLSDDPANRITVVARDMPEHIDSQGWASPWAVNQCFDFDCTAPS